MAMEALGAAGLANDMKQYYSKRLLSVAEPNLVYQNWGLKVNIPVRGGKSIEWRKFEKFDVGTPTALTEGTPGSETNATISVVSATISQYGAYSRITDVLETQTLCPVLDQYAEKFGIHMAETLDTVARDILAAGTTIQYASTAATRTEVASGMYINSAELREAVRTLKRNNAKPINGRWICVLHPDNTKDLYADADIVDAFKDAAPRGPGNPLFTGELGDWMGIKFIETTNAKVWTSLGSAGCDVYGVMLFGQEAYGVTELDALQAKMIVHPRGTGGHTDPLDQYSTAGWKAATATKILNQSNMVRIECTSSYSA